MEKQATHLAVPVEVFNQMFAVVRSLPDSQVHDLVEAVKEQATGVNLEEDVEKKPAKK